MKKKTRQFKQFIQQATSVLQRLWHKIGDKGVLQALPTPHTFALSRLCGIDRQMQQLVRNTEQFLLSRSANNVLLTGARGTGKSSLVKALLHEYADCGLRLVEVDKSDLLTLPHLLQLLRQRPEKFILYCDDLSFEAGDETYKALKTVLDGGLSVRCANVLVYATSNRRHLMPEFQAENDVHLNEQGEIHPLETAEEKVSLSDRFGLWLHFYPFSQDDYLAAVASWLEDAGLQMDETAKRAALQWAGARGGRSGRVAWQFVCDWAGREPAQRVAL